MKMNNPTASQILQTAAQQLADGGFKTIGERLSQEARASFDGMIGRHMEEQDKAFRARFERQYIRRSYEPLFFRPRPPVTVIVDFTINITIEETTDADLGDERERASPGAEPGRF